MNTYSGHDFIEIEALWRFFKEMLNKFELDTKGESHIQIVLRAHLYIENELNKLLNNALKHPEIIVNYMRFVDKLRLVFAIGILPIDEMDVIKKINRLRNSFAHDLSFEINDSIIEEITNSFSENQRKVFSTFYKSETDLTNKLRTALFTTWIMLFEANHISFEMGNNLVKYEIGLLTANQDE
ncbi:hypothetical protein QJQ58_09380 [Paenibacillus dendritiformis]|uniref:hypothetical protein n=1 Tax=Paenibacillus dendritiformis TaxID=130049 RepID=UPI00248BFF43|nr:hypothetical protein [Paenibacillus dendritiformis]WGU96424.1 hypothetical protein QJQ58_09380 [Paenibacillus dendritiformis]